MTAPNNPTPPLRDCSTGTTDQLEHLLRHLKKAKQAHSQAVHGIRKELKEAYKTEESPLNSGASQTIAGDVSRYQRNR